MPYFQAISRHRETKYGMVLRGLEQTTLRTSLVSPTTLLMLLGIVTVAIALSSVGLAHAQDKRIKPRRDTQQKYEDEFLEFMKKERELERARRSDRHPKVDDVEYEYDGD